MRTLVLPPPELAPALQALRDDPTDASAWAAVADMHVEAGGAAPVYPDGVVGTLCVEKANVYVLPARLYQAISCTLVNWRRYGPALAAWHPIQDVNITDIKPWPSDGNNRCDESVAVRWGWFGTKDSQDDGDIPCHLHDLLENGDTTGFSYFKWYSTKAKSLDALGKALVLWALDGCPIVEAY